METANDILELKLQGGGVKPNTLKAKELAELIESLEDALFHLVSRDHPEISKEELFISLVDIQDQSAGLRFIPKLRSVLVLGFLTISSALQTSILDGLPIKTIESLKVIQRFTRRRNCDAEFRLNDDTYAIIYPNTVIEIPASAYITGSTTIYPVVKRTGGNDPTVALSIADSYLVFARAPEEIVKKLGQRLYTTVGLTGFAKWERESLRLVEFKIDKILDYQETSIRDSFGKIGAVLSKYYESNEGKTNQYIGTVLTKNNGKVSCN